jgi:hypothetical protein
MDFSGLIEVKQQIGKDPLQNTSRKASAPPASLWFALSIFHHPIFRRQLLQVQHVHARALKATDTTTPLELPLARIDSRKLTGQKRWGLPIGIFSAGLPGEARRAHAMWSGACACAGCIVPAPRRPAGEQRRVGPLHRHLQCQVRLGALTRCDLGRVCAPGASCQCRVDLLPAMMLMCLSS